MPSPKMLTMKAAAEELGVSRATLYRWRQLGIGPRIVTHASGTLRVRQDDLNAYLDSATRVGAAE